MFYFWDVYLLENTKMEQISIIPNTWRDEFLVWFEELQKKRRKDFSRREKSHSSEDSFRMNELYFRNWGHINFAFADYYFDLLAELKEENHPLNNKYAHKANEWLLYYDLDKGVNKKDYMEEYFIEKYFMNINK